MINQPALIINERWEVHEFAMECGQRYKKFRIRITGFILEIREIPHPNSGPYTRNEGNSLCEKLVLSDLEITKSLV